MQLSSSGAGGSLGLGINVLFNRQFRLDFNLKKRKEEVRSHWLSANGDRSAASLPTRLKNRGNGSSCSGILRVSLYETRCINANTHAGLFGHSTNWSSHAWFNFDCKVSLLRWWSLGVTMCPGRWLQSTGDPGLPGSAEVSSAEEWLGRLPGGEHAACWAGVCSA